MTTDTKTDTLARLRKLAQEVVPQGPWRGSPWHIEEGEACVRQHNYGIVASVASDELASFLALCDPQTILRLLDVIAAADDLRRTGYPSRTAFPEAVAYDAARAALDKP